jgi:WXXGXW repeat (2 copies)
MNINRLIRLVPVLLFAFALLAMPRSSAAQVAIGITIAPPPLLTYEQPVCPEDGYIWTPGYWAYSEVDGYYWVPGTWVEAPTPGYLWTPGYWAFSDGFYGWHAGYWGPVVGFYGGINYGFGYFGNGYEGGHWDHNQFYYNRSVNNVNTTIVHNTYDTTVVNETRGNRTSYNGGSGGTSARPTPAESAAARGPHEGPTSAQVQQEHTASTNRAQFASENRGKQAVMATERAGDFKGQGVVTAKLVAPKQPNEARPYESPNRNGSATPAPETNKPENKPSLAPKHEAAPTKEFKPAPAPKHEAAPTKEFKPAPAPKHESTTPKESKPGPAPKSETARAPKHESAPAEKKPQTREQKP